MSRDETPARPCERHGAEISALADGELSRSEQLAAVDHLAGCPECRAFYRRVRTLGGLAAALSEPSLEDEPPEALWGRIRAAAADSLGRRGGLGEWLPRLAALLFLAFGLWTLGSARESSRAPAAGERLEIVLGENEGGMSEERFLEIAAELLRADRRYHREMLRVMSAVAGERESTDEGTREPSEGRRFTLGEEEATGEGVRWSGFRL